MAHPRHDPIRRRARVALGLVCAAALCGCAQLRERLQRNRPPAGPPPVEVPTNAAFLGFDRVLRAPGEPDGAFQLIAFPDSTGSRRLADGDSAVLLDLPGPAIVRRIRLSLTSADPDWLRRVALRMYWDDEPTPSVDVPLGDFFADGFERRPYASVPMGVGEAGFYSYLPMPFARRGRIVLQNGTGAPIEGLRFDADVQAQAALPVPLATFHAAWRRDARPRSTDRHEVADIHGAGWYVGTSLSAQGYEGTLSFLEGNGVFRVDGDRYAEVATSGYLNAGAGAPAGAAMPGAFAGVTLRDDARARVAAYRFHLPDPVPFRSSLRLELERGRANRDAADFATVAYWYQSEPHEPGPPLPFPSERRVPAVLIPAEAQRMGDLEMMGTAAGTVRLTASVPRPDLYEVVVYPEASPGSASPTVAVRGSRRPPRTLDVSPPGAEPGDLLPGVVVDTVAVRARTLDLELVARGGGIALPAAVHLRPLDPWADQWQVVGPWPWGGTASVTSPTDFVWPPELDPAATEYAAPARSGSAPPPRLSWLPADVDAAGTLSFARLFPGAERATAYAQTFLWSGEERVSSLLLRTDDAVQIWVGGLPVATGVAAAGEMEIPVILRPGWNRILLEVAGTAGWSVRLRAADPTGGLRWSRRPVDG